MSVAVLSSQLSAHSGCAVVRPLLSVSTVLTPPWAGASAAGSADDRLHRRGRHVVSRPRETPLSELAADSKHDGGDNTTGETFKLPEGVTVLMLYKRILWNAQRFPSIKRAELVSNIKREFRNNRAITDPAKLAKCYEIAVRGVNQLEKYTSLDRDAPNWTIDLEKDPLGAGPADDDVSAEDAAGHGASGKGAA